MTPSGRTLDLISNADMMSDMKTYTVRELDRQPGLVLEACDTDGVARIRCRDGRTYVIKPEAQPRSAITLLPDFSARRGKLFRKAGSRPFTQKFDQAISGE